jgi:hypothetical protein
MWVIQPYIPLERSPTPIDQLTGKTHCGTEEGADSAWEGLRDVRLQKSSLLVVKEFAFEVCCKSNKVHSFVQSNSMHKAWNLRKPFIYGMDGGFVDHRNESTWPAADSGNSETCVIM